MFTFIYYYFQTSKMCTGKCHKHDFRIWKGTLTGCPPFYSNMCFSELRVLLSRKQNMKTNNQAPPVNDWWSEKATFDSSDVNKQLVCSWCIGVSANLQNSSSQPANPFSELCNLMNCISALLSISTVHVFSPGDAFSNYRTTEGKDHSK